MFITELLSEPLVLPALKGQTKEHVLRELAESLAAQYPEINAGRLLDVLCERERLGSTGIAKGVAIPHGRLAGLPRMFGVFGRHEQGIDFDSLDGTPTKLFFLLVAPTEAVGPHLKALSHVSRLVNDSTFVDSLLDAGDRRELYLRIVAHDAS